MKHFVSFGTDCQSIVFMSTRLLKYKIDLVCIPQFQVAYICNRTHPSHIFLLSCVMTRIISDGGNKSWMADSNFRKEVEVYHDAPFNVKLWEFQVNYELMINLSF